MRVAIACGAWLAFTAGAVLAQAPASGGQGSVQQAFDAADALAAKGDRDAALAAYRALAARVKNARTRAILQLRQGELLIQSGREAEGRAMLRQGLAALPPNDAGSAAIRTDSLIALAHSEELAFDLPQALADYRAAAAAASGPAERLSALPGVVRVGMFIDPAAAVRDADAALALVAAGTTDKAQIAPFRS